MLNRDIVRDTGQFKKIGYVWILTDDTDAEAVKQLDTPEAMLTVLFQGIIDELNDPR